MKYIFFLLIITFSIVQGSQIEEDAIPYSTIENMIKDLEEDPKDQWVHILSLIEKAKQEKNIKKLHRAYSFASTYSRGNQQVKYGDSLLQTAFKLKDSDIIGDCYLSRGMIYSNEEKYTFALEAFIKGYSFIEKKGNPYLVNNAEYQIAQTKIYLGQYREANKILKKVVSFFRDNHKKTNNTDYGLYYIYSLIALIDTNSHIGNFTDNQKLIPEGFAFIKTNKDYSDYYSYFISLEGTDAYYQKDYDKAINRLNLALQLSDDNWKHLTENYYLGLSYWAKGDRENSLPYLEKIHQEYLNNKKLDPQFREAIELLTEYYKMVDNPAKQLIYINDLITLNKTYEKDYREIYSSLNKNYDTHKLIIERDTLKKEATTNKIIYSIFVFILMLIISHYLWKAYQKHKVSNKETNENIPSNEESEYFTSTSEENTFIENEITQSDLDINPLIVEHILTYLKTFEKERKFLNKECSLISIAKECGTNTSYLSKIVNHYKGENFISYLNTLRIEYIIEQWKKKPKFRHHTLQQIADFSGFNTAQSFSKNFHDRYSKSPKAFLKHLQKEAVPN